MKRGAERLVIYAGVFSSLGLGIGLAANLTALGLACSTLAGYLLGIMLAAEANRIELAQRQRVREFHARQQARHVRLVGPDEGAA